MKRKNLTRNALVTSILSLLLCVSMLVGTTFAWFTDEVVSGRNTIAAGNLDIELLAGGNPVDNSTVLFDNIELWEPGAVVYENLKIANVGTLALKYRMTLDVLAENSLNGHKLSEVVKVAVLNDTQIDASASRQEILAMAKSAIKGGISQGILSNFYDAYTLEAGADRELAIVIFWEPGDNDNDYNANNGQKTSDGKPLFIEFGLNLQATQKMSESDSFGNDYDQFASFLPKATVINTGRKDVFARPFNSWQQEDTRAFMTMDTSYQFLPNESATAADLSDLIANNIEMDSPYRYYHADWVVTVDRDVRDGSAVLAGYYRLFGEFMSKPDWIYLTAPMTANQPVRLLKDGMGASVTYQMVCAGADDGIGFLCGAADLTGENAGTTLTVELRLYETTKAPDAVGGTANEETGEFITIGTFQYTFGTNSAAGFQAALNAGVPNIILESDIELNDAPMVIPAGSKTVIDLNGHTITGVSTSATTSNLIKVEAGAELTLTGNGMINFAATTPDTNWGGEGQPAFPGYANNTFSNLGKLVIDGVTIKNSTAPGGASYAIDCYQGSELIVNDGVIDGMGKVAIRMFCNSNTEETKVTVNGGLITGRRGIWVQLPGSKLENVRPVSLTVNGGKIIATDANDCAIYSYSYGDSFAQTNITITGGEFDGLVAFGGGNKTTKENVTITGGTFQDGVGRYLENDVWEEISVPTV